MVGEDSPTGGGGRVFRGSAHRCTAPVSAAPQACPAQGRAAGHPQHLPSSLLPSRAQQHSRGPSFQSISASGLNAALAHYRYSWGSGGQREGGSRERPLTPSPCSPSNGSSRTLSVREMYLFDTGGQYLCVALNRDPHHSPTPRGPQSQCWGCTSPVHDPSLQGRDDRHHSHSALERAHPTAEGTSPSRVSQHPSARPSTPLHCPELPMAFSSAVLARAGCAGLGMWVPPHSPCRAMPYRKPTPVC